MMPTININDFKLYLTQHYPKNIQTIVNDTKFLAKAMYVFYSQQLLRHFLNNTSETSTASTGQTEKYISNISNFFTDSDYNTDHEDNYLLIPIHIDNN
tara:strand:- start:836 stop:1129 length:294 start_codon:yes stop_codon:yes gene_type:complete